MSVKSLLKALFLSNRSFASTINVKPKGKALPSRVYQARYDSVFAGAIRASDDLGWHLLCADRTRGDIAVQRPWGLSTWGDRITISLRSVDNQNVRVEASSYAPGELYDWGRHARNIRHYLVDLDSQVRA